MKNKTCLADLQVEKATIDGQRLGAIRYSSV